MFIEDCGQTIRITEVMLSFPKAAEIHLDDECSNDGIFPLKFMCTISLCYTVCKYA